MENFEPIQMLIGDLTIEQFCNCLGVAFGIVLISLIVLYIIFSIFTNFHNGWLFYKTKEYYGSLKYLNKRFKALKTASCQSAIKNEFLQTRNTIELLRCQDVIPKFLYFRLYDKACAISKNRLLEVFENEEK